MCFGLDLITLIFLSLLFQPMGNNPIPLKGNGLLAGVTAPPGAQIELPKFQFVALPEASFENTSLVDAFGLYPLGLPALTVPVFPAALVPSL